MKEKLKFLWIDDQKSRKKQNEYLNNNQITSKFELVSEKNLLKLLFEKIFKEDEPDLILIDHILDKVKSNFVESKDANSNFYISEDDLRHISPLL